MSLGLNDPSLDQAYNNATAEIEQDSLQTGNSNLQTKISKPNIWKKMGGPRKVQKWFTFFELKENKRRKINKFIGNKLPENSSYDSVQFKDNFTKKDLAEEILETCILMGLIPNQRREEAIVEIRKQISSE